MPFAPLPYRSNAFSSFKVPLRDPHYELFKQDFSEQFDQFKKEGKLQGVTLTRWTDASPEHPRERRAYFTMPLKKDLNNEVFLRFNCDQIDNYYYDDSDNESEKKEYINGSLNKLTRVLNRIKKDDNK